MLLRARCCYVEDVYKLKILLRSKCCYFKDVVAIKMLLRSRNCYVQDVVTLKKVNNFHNGFVDVKGKEADVHFALGSLVDYDFCMFAKKPEIR